MRGAGVACLGLAFLAVLAACGGGGDTPPPADPEQVLRRAAERLKDVKSFHFSLGHENGTTAMPLNLDLVSAEGDVAVPDRLAADVVAKASGVTRVLVPSPLVMEMPLATTLLMTKPSPRKKS